MELVEGLGVSLPAHEVLGAVRDSKTASSLTRKLMSLLFTNEEMATSSVRGKTKRPLNKQKMEAIIGYNTCEYNIVHDSRSFSFFMQGSRSASTQQLPLST